MITKIGDKDRFAYDDGDRATAVEIKPGFYVFGYNFCARLKETERAGFVEIIRLYAKPQAFVLLYSQAAKTAEIWHATWSTAANGTCHLVNPSYIGLLNILFDSAADVHAFIAGSQRVPLREGYLDTSTAVPTLIDPHVTASEELAYFVTHAPPLYPDRVVDPSKFPPDNEAAIEDLEYVIKSIYTYVFRLNSAVCLNRYADKMHFSHPATIPPSPKKFQMLLEWKQIAARDAAFSVFHFQRTFETLRVLLKDYPGVRDMVDTVKLRTAWKLYRSWFSEAVITRHAIGHTAEFYATVESRAQHATHTDIFIESMMVNTTLSVSAFGRLVSIDVSGRTVERLSRVRDLILEALAAMLRSTSNPPAESARLQQD